MGNLKLEFSLNFTDQNLKKGKEFERIVTMGLDFQHMIKARAHRGGVRIGKTPKKLASICCP
jgi:hypothetical protein